MASAVLGVLVEFLTVVDVMGTTLVDLDFLIDTEEKSTLHQTFHLLSELSQF